MSHWLKKVWEGNMVFEEAICFLQDGDHMTGGDLLYAPAKILKVTKADGTGVYEEGKDYTINGKKLVRTTASNIPIIQKDTCLVPFTGEKDKEWLRMKGGEKYFKIFPEIVEYQVLVTYQHNDLWDGEVPENISALLPRTMRMLKQKEHLNLVFYGDSITAGWEASGCDEHVIDMVTLEEFHNYSHKPPYMPAWPTLVTEAIMEHYDYKDITKVNLGAGGSTSAWGDINADRLVNPHKPDFVILAFGMNNLQDEPDKFEREIRGIISTIRGQNPNCEFLLLSPMIANSEIEALADNKLPKHEEVLFQLQKSMTGVAAAPVNSMFREIARAGKQYFDITGNCINHPNDFSVRIYAQTVLSALGI